jgi:hypothetical protein
MILISIAGKMPPSIEKWLSNFLRETGSEKSTR